ncbi:MAG: hypothetical protein KBS38_03495, partial [Bacteroidales bacterium]|nr:hypothetical protein [Candidatus Cacconaster caballi]
QGGRSSASGRISPEGACLRPEWNLLRLAACGETSFNAGEVPLPDAFPRKGLACGRSGIFFRLAANGETCFRKNFNIG